MLARITKLLLLFALVPLTACSVSVPSKKLLRLFKPHVKSPSRLSDVQVEVDEAIIIDGQEVHVTALVYNHTRRELELDRGGIYLRRGGDGFIGQPERRASEPFVLAPYANRKISVSFVAQTHIATEELYLVFGGARFVGAESPSILKEIPLEELMVAKRSPRDTPPGAAEPPAPPASDDPPVPPGGVTIPRTVGVDMSRLTEHDFDHFDGAQLERRLVARLVQDGFAVVAATERPDTLVVVTAESASLMLDVRGHHGSRTRAIADAGQVRDALHQEVAQKCSAMVHATAEPPPPPTKP